MTDDVAGHVLIGAVPPLVGGTERTVDNLVKSGTLTRVQLNGRTYVTEDSLKTYMVMVRWLAGHVLPEAPRP